MFVLFYWSGLEFVFFPIFLFLNEVLIKMSQKRDKILTQPVCSLSLRLFFQLQKDGGSTWKTGSERKAGRKSARWKTFSGVVPVVCWHGQTSELQYGYDGYAKPRPSDYQWL